VRWAMSALAGIAEGPETGCEFIARRESPQMALNGRTERAA